MTNCLARVRDRSALFVSTPTLWPAWPFLPVVRRSSGQEELGVMFDAHTVCGLTGYSTTVFLTNMFELPASFTEFLALPHETFDLTDELIAAGWRVD